jgi:DNA-directed RNA polymerase specialized sigma24 family protein
LLEEVYGAHFDRLCALSSAITLDRSLGAEIVHDAFAGLAGRIDAVEDPVAYLQRSVVNLSIRAIQRRDRLRRTPKVPVRHHVSVEVDDM